MAEQDQSRPEQASPFKLEQARKRGNVARGQDLPTVAVLLALAACLWVAAPGEATSWARMARRLFAEAAALGEVPPAAALAHVAAGLGQGLRLVLPLLLVLAGAALVAVWVQVGFLFAPQAIKPDAERLNPRRVLERLFSIQTPVDLLRTSLKLAAAGLVARLLLGDRLRTDAQGAAAPLHWVAALYDATQQMLFALVGVFVLFAAAELLFVRWQYARQMRMSRRELREEMRQREGDPLVRQLRRRLQGEMLKKVRSLRAMRGADVLLTNPTHVAVALRYDPATMLAPRAVAKGAGLFALRLRRLALVYGVPVVEQRQLARLLYRKVALDDELPPTMYEPVARVYQRLRAAGVSGARA